MLYWIIPVHVELSRLVYTRRFERLGWGAKFGSDDFELKGHLLSMVV